MSSPRTLPALRAAVARVLVARGEAADALVCDGGMGAHWYDVALSVPGIDHPIAYLSALGDSEAHACGAAWETVVRRIDEDSRRARREAEACARAMTAAVRRVAVAESALAVAREIGGEE